MPALVVKSGRQRGAILDMPSERISMGRAPSNDLVLDDPTVSREHALLLCSSGHWQVEDLGSHNSVLVNGVPTVRAAVDEGDEIQLGGVALAFFLSRPAAEAAQGPSEAQAAAEVTRSIPLERAAYDRDYADERIGQLLTLGGLAAAVRALPPLFEGVEANLRAVLGAVRVVTILREEDGRWRPYRTEPRAFGESLAEVQVDAALVERAHREGPVAGRAAHGGCYFACVPMRVGARSVGALYCERPCAGKEFGEEELVHLFYVAVGMGVAVHGLRVHERLASRARSLTRQLAEHFDMVGESEAMKRVYRLIHRIAPTGAGVFICGATGTGKERVARAVHHHSRRSEGPLEIVDCAAVPVSLMDSELFGHVRGAFTGAVADRPGRFELASGGTLFLDEVADLPLECQAKLLRVLEEHKVRPIGETRDREVDVRLISATNRDPAEAVADGTIRPDLLYRLDRLRIEMPPLREREGDVALLAEHFRRKFSRECKRPLREFRPEVLEAFRAYHWPGNVREIRNVVERMVLLAEAEELGPELIPQDILTVRPAQAGEAPPLSEVEREHIVRVLGQTGGNKKRAAKLLGIDRSTLYAKIKKYGIATSGTGRQGGVT